MPTTSQTLERGELVSEAIVEACANGGVATIDELFPIGAIMKIAHEARRLPEIMKRRITDPEWQNVRRATLIPGPWQEEDLRHITHVISPSRWWAPFTHSIVSELSGYIRYSGEYLKVPTLDHWSPTRVGFNYLDGSPLKPAYIGEHTDVEEEKGLVIAINISSEDSDEALLPGKTQLLLGSDTCDYLGIVARKHDAYAEAPRVGLTIADLRL